MNPINPLTWSGLLRDTHCTVNNQSGVLGTKWLNGGTGRRVGLRSRCPKGREGSSPSLITMVW